MSPEPEAVLTSDALRTMHNAGRGALPFETGGILVGFRDRAAVIVTRALVVVDESSTRVAYQLERERAEARLAELRAQVPDVVGYVGDWHTHPRDAPPSALDLRSFERAAASSRDLVALVVIPFRDGEPRPAHVLVARPEPGRARSRRSTPVIREVVARTFDAPADRLEQEAQDSMTSRPASAR